MMVEEIKKSQQTHKQITKSSHKPSNKENKGLEDFADKMCQAFKELAPVHPILLLEY